MHFFYVKPNLTELYLEKLSNYTSISPYSQC